MDLGFYFEVMGIFWNYIQVVVAQHCELLNAIELSTLNG